MGFGSYDESEQRESVATEDDDAAVTVHENDYEGELTLENGDSTEDLLGQLQEIKASKERTED